MRAFFMSKNSKTELINTITDNGAINALEALESILIDGTQPLG